MSLIRIHLILSQAMTSVLSSFISLFGIMKSSWGGWFKSKSASTLYFAFVIHLEKPCLIFCYLSMQSISLLDARHQGSTLIFKVACPFRQVRFEIHLSCMRCHLSTNPNPCRNMGIVQFCATIFDFSPVPSDKWHCKTTCPRRHFQHFYLSWTVGQPLRSSPGHLLVSFHLFGMTKACLLTSIAEQT